MSRRCIVPPHLLERIAEHGNPEHARAAIATLEQDRTERAWRRTPHRILGAQDGQHARTVYDGRHDENDHNDSLVRSEGQAPVADTAANEAYDGLGDTLSLYASVFARDSIDGRGLDLEAVVHYGRGYDNAFWDGTAMRFGDGDGRYFQRFTVAVDVIGHELTHGVTGATCNLDYQGQPGALNESVSDVFGSLVKQRALGHSATGADWLIGEGLFTAAVHGRALRDMLHPGTAYDDPVLGKDPQPADMAGYVQTADDDGGVHLNSGIPNRAFALAAVAAGGFAWETVGPVWYAVLADPATPSSSTFEQWAAATVAKGGAYAGVIRQAWETVGVLAAAPAPDPGPSPAPDPGPTPPAGDAFTATLDDRTQAHVRRLAAKGGAAPDVWVRHYLRAELGR